MKDIQTYIDEQIKQNNEELLSKILKMITPLETNNAKTDSRAKRWFMRNKQNLIVFAVCFVIFSVIFHMLNLCILTHLLTLCQPAVEERPSYILQTSLLLLPAGK